MKSAGVAPSLLSLLSLFLLLAGLVEMVKHEDFKTCSQSSFCRRNKAFAEKQQSGHALSPYTLDAAKVTLKAGVLSGVVMKTLVKGDPIALPLKMTFLKSGVARFTLDEQRRRDLDIVLPSGKEERVNKARYDQAEKHTIVGGLDVDTSVTQMNTAEGVTTIRYGPVVGYSVRIQHAPLKVFFLRGDEVQIVFNDRALLNMEHWRPRTTPKEAVEGEDAPSNLDDNGEDLTGMWEEDFNGRPDSKPRGPESLGLDITFVEYGDVYGIPEHTGTLSLKETTGGPDGFSDPYRLYNTDVFQYEYDSPMALYGSIPFMQAHKLGSDVGIFWLNGAETWIDIQKTSNNPLSFSKQSQSTQTHWVSEAGLLDVFVFMGPTAPALYKSFGELVGFTRLPPMFAIAHHQCRWNYESEVDVLDVTANFDKHDIPYDVIWLDVEYTVGKRYFTWNKDFFPDPVRMMDKLDATKRKLVAIIDPHIKVDTEFPLYNEAISGKHVIKNADGNPYEGQCWPGLSVWPDFTKPETCSWWANWFQPSKFEGSKSNLHVWNDMNEPAIFSGPDISMHRDSLHQDGWEHRDLHNIYGTLMIKSTYEGLKTRDKEEPKRPFILSRSFWAGMQRWGAVWTGDNMGTWEHLESATATNINNGIAGMTFSGADVGGFFDDPPKDLLARWYQAGAFYPFFRAHAHIDTKRREPWIAGEPYTSIIRKAIVLRYSLLTTWYTAFYEASQTGMPVLRPHFIVFPDDAAGFKVQDQYFIGDSGLLHHPVVKKDATSISLYLADDEPYYCYHTFDVTQGKGRHTIEVPDLTYNPVFMHGGHIITRRDRQRRSSELMRKDPVTLVVAFDKQGHAAGSLYLDDGETFRHEQGEYILRQFTAAGNRVSSTNTHQQPDKARPYEDSITSVRVEKVLLVGYTGAATRAKVSQGGRDWEVEVDVVKELGKGRTVLAVRDPAVLVSQDWQIELI
ncbi:glycosyl hydrolases family 31-domain-containing protein [Protomyces lactucae-debilis]|uniref:Glucosidase II subunit alpha n=1 Tax=Protomyces lactucae-debilis TaxID=2754530 RepID=A0A1Y2F596_PROLT|nr:glycosyl hydrolases family 31-domain-containing protein [Protomyces lactucae-debilis]ORY79023.1 glycosyl hydrolases family 31-domain-containing protein [Protomyces lactucae-debilis]